MENAASLSVPLLADMHTGRNWYEAKSEHNVPAGGNELKVLGITGGVGSGKSQVLAVSAGKVSCICQPDG